LAEFVKLYVSRVSASEGPETENSWNVDVRSLSLSKGAEADLSVKNPNKKEEIALRSPQAILEEIRALDEESAEILNTIAGLI
jgi:type I restriction enzyme M protein